MQGRQVRMRLPECLRARGRCFPMQQCVTVLPSTQCGTMWCAQVKTSTLEEYAALLLEATPSLQLPTVTQELGVYTLLLLNTAHGA